MRAACGRDERLVTSRCAEFAGRWRGETKVGFPPTIFLSRSHAAKQLRAVCAWPRTSRSPGSCSARPVVALRDRVAFPHPRPEFPMSERCAGAAPIRSTSPTTIPSGAPITTTATSSRCFRARGCAGGAELDHHPAQARTLPPRLRRLRRRACRHGEADLARLLADAGIIAQPAGRSSRRWRTRARRWRRRAPGRWEYAVALRRGFGADRAAAQLAEIPAQTAASQAMSRELKRLRSRFVGADGVLCLHAGGEGMVS